MTYFEQALFAPQLHFKQLRQMEPLLCNGSVIIRSSHHAIESEILWEGRHYLLHLPFKQESLLHIEELEEIACERGIGPLIPYKILYDEFTHIDSLGNKHSNDIILQEIPAGMLFREAIEHFKASDLRSAILRMKERLDNIGFCHNNLRPDNIVICKSGVARPLRYWYAEWEEFSDNNISLLLEAIDYHDGDEEDAKSALVLNDDSASYSAPSARGGIFRKCKGSRYGFVDSDNRLVAPYIYSWASDFFEGRAIVAKNGKMGVIDSNGKKVLPVIYNHIEFDVETGCFIATNASHRHIFDYDGNHIREAKNKKKALNKVEV